VIGDFRLTMVDFRLATACSASRPLGRGHPARAFLAGAGRSRHSGRDARATFADGRRLKADS